MSSPLLAALLLAALPLVSLPLAAQAQPTEAEPAAEPDGAAQAEKAAPPPPARQPVVERNRRDAAELARTLPKQAIELQGADERFLGLWLPANTPKAKGTVVLLPSEGETADGPRAPGPIREYLPDHGWNTLSITLPDPPIAEPLAAQRRATDQQPAEAANAAESAPTEETLSEADSDPQQAPDGAQASLPIEAAAAAEPPVTSEPAPADFETRVFARIQAAIDHAQTQQPAMIVLLGHGTGAHWAVRYLMDGSPEGIGALGMIDATTMTETDGPLSESLATLKLPVLDLYHRANHADAAAQARRDALARAGHQQLTQVRLNAVVATQHQRSTRLVRRVRGWLDRLSGR